MYSHAAKRSPCACAGTDSKHVMSEIYALVFSKLAMQSPKDCRQKLCTRSLSEDNELIAVP
jgi:hypothetical protein